MIRLLLLASLLISSLNCLAKIEEHSFEHPAHEKRYNVLIDELRCLVCQNQNLADSNAELAQDLRAKVYDMIVQGSSDKDIVKFMVERYGDFVLYRPPFNISTLVLWLGPFILMLVALFALIKFINLHRQTNTTDITETDKKRIKSLLSNKDSEL